MKTKYYSLFLFLVAALLGTLAAEESTIPKPKVYDIVKGEIPPKGTIEWFGYEFINEVRNSSNFELLLKK